MVSEARASLFMERNLGLIKYTYTVIQAPTRHVVRILFVRGRQVKSNVQEGLVSDADVRQDVRLNQVQ